jgi:hypothetical protein
MAVSTQSRKPERAEAQNSTRTQGIPAPREACLSVRLWAASGNSEPLPSLWENENPAACLLLDLIAASEGIPASRQGDVLTATFLTFQTAVFAARRLQWAVQGFSEAERLQATSLALLVHSPEEEHGETIAEDALHSLEQAAPGEILLTEKASQPFDSLPGFPLQVASGDGLWELLWRAPERQSTRSYDEQILAQLVEQHGVDHPEHQKQPPAAEADYAAQAEAEDLREPEHAHGSSHGKMVGLAVAALVVVGAVIFYFTQGKSNPAPAPDQTQAQTQPQTEQQPATAAQGGPASPSGPAARPAASPAKQERNAAPAAAKTPQNPAKAEVKPPPVAPAPERERPAPKPAEPPPSRASSNARCDLDPSQYSGLVDQAEKNQGRGKYAAAIRQFIAVLACDPGNARAKQGLERARNAAAAADGSSQN